MTKPTLVMHEKVTDYMGVANRGSIVAKALTSNLSYITPAIPILTISGMVTSVLSGITAWGDVHNRGSHTDLMNLKNQTLILFNNLRAELNYCETTAVATAGTNYVLMTSILSTCGFDLKHAKTPQGPLEAVKNFQQFKNAELNKNQTEISWDAPANVTSANNVNAYDIYISDTNDFTVAVHIGSTKPTKFIYTNPLTTSVMKYFFVIAIGSAGEGAISAALGIAILGA